jgi:hypothetical protein
MGMSKEHETEKAEQSKRDEGKRKEKSKGK